MYNAQYFIDRFSAIPEKQWTINEFIDEHNRSCANGHLGCRIDLFNEGVIPEEVQALQKVISVLDIHSDNKNLDQWQEYAERLGYSVKAAIINNGECPSVYPQPTPKQRILAALNDALILEQTDGAVAETNHIIANPIEELV